MLALGPSRAPSLAIDPDGPRAAPALIGVATVPAPPAPRHLSAFRVSRDVDVTVTTLLKSVSAVTYYRVAPGLALGASSGVATLDLPDGQVRAVQLLGALRIKF